MSFIASFVHFIVVFMFTLGLTNLVTSVLAIFFLRDEIPSYKIMFIQNICSAFFISLSYLITINFLPGLYKEVKVNTGTIILKSKYWKKNVDIYANEKEVIYKLCNKEIKIENNMFKFYNSLNNSLKNCDLEQGDEVRIEIVSNPFEELDEVATNSILRKYTN
jgi:hypothetical protein